MEKYIIISPIKNESKFISQTIDSVLNQTILPLKWLIIDDGSTDNTYDIVNNKIEKYKWLKLIKRDTKNQIRSGGANVVNAFNQGYSLIKDSEYDLIIKLDGDLILPDNYFETIIKEFNNNPKLGCCGGYCLNKYSENKLIREHSAKYHVRGAFKCYRKECFIQIGGFDPIWNWDGIDEMKANYFGWQTYSIELPVIHLRPTTSSYNLFKHAFKSGYESYKLRSNLFLTVIRTTKRFTKKPFLFNGILFFMGYIKAFFSREKFIINKSLGKFINNFHLKRIIK